MKTKWKLILCRDKVAIAPQREPATKSGSRQCESRSSSWEKNWFLLAQKWRKKRFLLDKSKWRSDSTRGSSKVPKHKFAHCKIKSNSLTSKVSRSLALYRSKWKLRLQSLNQMVLNFSIWKLTILMIYGSLWIPKTALSLFCLNKSQRSAMLWSLR